MSQKSTFWGPFHKQQAKRAETLLEPGDRIFTIFIDCCKHNIVGKSLF